MEVFFGLFVINVLVLGVVLLFDSGGDVLEIFDIDVVIMSEEFGNFSFMVFVVNFLSLCDLVLNRI